MSTPPPPPAPPTSTPPSRVRPPLRRDPDVGIIGGVAAGLARHLDVDVVLIRIAFVVGALLTQGLAVLAYVLGWVFVPKATPEERAAAVARPSGRRDRADDGRGATFWLGVGLLALGAIWFLGAVSTPGLAAFRLVDRGVVLPLLLIGLGIALWRTGDRNDTSATSSASRPPATATSPSESAMPTTSLPAPETAPDGTVRVDPVDQEPGSPPPPPPSAPSMQAGGDGGFTPPPVPERERSFLTRLTLGVALLTVGVLWILEVTTALSLGPLPILAIGLAIIGAGLLVGSVVGRGRALIVVGVLLLPLVLAGTVLRGLPAGPLIEGGLRGDARFGELIEQPATADELASTYSLGAGRLELDLRGLELDDDASVAIEIGAGEVEVFVPSDVNVDASGSLGLGELRLFDVRRTGFALDAEGSLVADVAVPADAPTLELRLDGGVGDLSVQR